jgi:teichuronic acid biosynthesis glycosyltransferase TuaH
MLPEYDVFMFGLTRSEFSLSSVSVAWAKEWAKTNRVFYIDRPYSLRDLLTKIDDASFRDKFSALFLGENIYREINFPTVSFTQVTPRITLPINFLPEGNFYTYMNQLNNKVIDDVVKKIIKDYGVKNYIFFNSFCPVTSPVISRKIQPQPLANIYQSLDEISQERYIARHGINAEFNAMRQCDIAIGTSSGLCDRHARENNRQVHLLANAADFDVFENATNKDLPKPLEFETVTKPIILYTGHYSDLRMDHELVKKIANKFSDSAVYFVGTYEKKDLINHGLNSISNLHFIGSRPIESLPAYLKYAQVAIIPYVTNELTKGIYPLKINEYLASGTPCVSTSFSNDIRSFEGLIYISNTHAEFIDNIQKAMEENTADKLSERIAHARENSWRTRIQKLESIIASFVAGEKV